MNARQKAKYWKKKYRELESLPVKPTIVVSDRKIETLSYSTVVNDEMYMLGRDNPEMQRVLFGKVIDELADQAKNFVDISVEKTCLTAECESTDDLLSQRLGTLAARPFRDYHDIYNTHWDVMHDKRENNGGMRNDK